VIYVPIVLYACTPSLQGLYGLDTLHHWRCGMLHNGTKHFYVDAVVSNAQAIIMHYAAMPVHDPPPQQGLLSFDGCMQHV